MRVAVRVVVLLIVFAVVGWWSSHAVLRHAGVGTPATQVKLSSAMAGLFAGGAAAVLVGIAMVWKRRQG